MIVVMMMMMMMKLVIVKVMAPLNMTAKVTYYINQSIFSPELLAIFLTNFYIYIVCFHFFLDNIQPTNTSLIRFRSGD